MTRRATVVMLVAWCARAHAGGLVIAGGSPRSIGRAGAGFVGDDGGGALLVDPAAMARRDAKRAQLALALTDDSLDWTPSAGDSPRAHDQAGSMLMPMAAVEGGIGDWIIGVGVMTSTVSKRALPDPTQLPADQLANRFDYRYAGIAGLARRDTVTLGVARRLGDAVAIGVAVAGSRVTLHETRALWAGFAGREMVGDPAHDLDLAISAKDDVSPSAVAGLLIAPVDTRVELGLSIGWAATAHTSGTLDSYPASTAIGVERTTPAARLDVAQPITLRTGARWLGQRWIAEVDADLWWFAASAASTSWQLTGLRVVDASGVGVDLDTLPSRLSAQTHGAVRGAIDAELIAGLLWLTAGYAYTTPGVSPSHQSLPFGDLGGHTAALGLDVTAGGFTISLGWARTWSRSRFIPNSAWRLDNPFGAGDGTVPSGRYDGSSDMVGLGVDAEL